MSFNHVPFLFLYIIYLWMKQYLILFLAMCFLISPPISAEQETIREITASEAVLDASSMRIICLTAATCEISYAIGAGDMRHWKRRIL